MAYDITRFNRSYEASGNIAAQQYRFVKLVGGTVAACAAATDPVVGVLQNKPNAAGVACTVAIDGVTFAISAKAITAGSVVYVDATGRVTDTAASNKAVGIAEIAATAADKVITVLLKPLGAL